MVKPDAVAKVGQILEAIQAAGFIVRYGSAADSGPARSFSQAQTRHAAACSLAEALQSKCTSLARSSCLRRHVLSTQHNVLYCECTGSTHLSSKTRHY